MSVDVEFEKIKANYDALREVIWERYRFMPTIAALSAASLAFFSTGVAQAHNYVKVLMTAFLILVILAPWAYMAELVITERFILSKFDQESLNAVRSHKYSFQTVRAVMPYVFLVVFTMLLGLAVAYIWGYGIGFIPVSNTSV